MQPEIEISALLQTVTQLERELHQLRMQVLELAMQQARTGTQACGAKNSVKTKYKPLKGIFPPSNTTMEDFCEARRSWTRKLDQEPLSA